MITESLFLAKKIASAAFYPVGMSIVLWVCGIVLVRRRPRSLFGIILILAGGLLLLIMSLPVTAHLLMRPLEIAAGTYAEPAKLSSMGVRHIVTLGGGAGSDKLTPADRVGGDLLRVMEGVRLWRHIPDAVLVLSGMGFPPNWNNADFMVELPLELGIPRHALVLETRAWDTREEARLFAELVGSRRFALVTSAYHMPRAMKQFKSLGLKPVAAPCEFLTSRFPPVYACLLPDAGALKQVQMAMHEYLGLLWLFIIDVIHPDIPLVK